MSSPHTITVYECIQEEEELIEERLLSISRLNKEGKILFREQFDIDGTLIKKEEYQYQGEHVVFSREADLIEKKINKTICEYQDDKLLNQKEYFNEDLSLEMVYTYNDNGELIQSEILNNDGSINSKYTYEYQDQKTTERFFDEEMTLVRMTETIEDDKGRIIEKRITEFYDNREVTNEQKIEYKVIDGESIMNYYNNGVEAFEIIECVNEDGRLVEKIIYDVEKDEELITMLEYDNRGLITKEEITRDEEVISVTNVEFDKYENRIKLTKYNKVAEDYEETATYKFVNEYDEEDESE